MRRSMRAYELAMSGAHDGKWEWNPITKKLRVGRRLLSLLGYAKDFLFSTHVWLELVHPELLVALLPAPAATKIDRSFIAALGEGHNGRGGAQSAETIIRAIIAMAHGLALEVVAEGVETRSRSPFCKASVATSPRAFSSRAPCPPMISPAAS